MNLKTVLTPKQSLNKAYLKEKVTRSNIELFKSHLIQFIDGIDDESEEHVKNLVTKFLNDTYYNGKNEINTKGRIDLAIYEDKKPVVIIEAKRPSSPDMVTVENLNTKAIHELLLYYLQERVEHGNIDIKYLIITNMNEWFVFDSSVFDSLFYKNSALMKDFNDWKNGRKARTDRDLFYNDIAKPFLKNLEEEIKFTWFDLRQVVKFAKNDNPKDDAKLIDLYKLLSPVHLLKQPFANDSNSLDTKFYNELLHIIGLEEKKDGGKKIIQRKEKSDEGSLLENTITMLVTEDPLHKLPGSGADFGETKEERVFSIALELCITWINRILFLKLLEGQLLNYHKGDKQYRFLDFKTIPSYDELNKLFFQVLARKLGDRTGSNKEKFSHVPYLNSSLFDVSQLEDDTLRISNLDGSLPLKLHNLTVLKNENGKRREGELPTLQYLFEFLDAYDFTSEGKEEIQEENKTLINASVLGLIFEKINGYKDGSFFTPGFITMYMCRETIRRATIQKFNEIKGWKLETFTQLYNKIDDIKEANDIINSLKICDPAVGSGHFLVSALNEIIAIKNDLKILIDRDGKRLKEYQVQVVNDELIVTDEEDELFEYNPNNKETQRVQEALFHEKQELIENCLFGVDINPNSVKICRLRLWIELLKNAYYTSKSKYKELETLPNIDINIKQGNSLISRFPLDADLTKALRKSKWNVDTYKIAIHNYHHANSKDEKREIEKLIETIKSNFETEIANYSDPRKKKLTKLGEQLFELTGKGRDGTGIMLFDTDVRFGKNDANAKKRKKEIEKIELEINKLTAEIKEIKDSALYRDAFEWRFEFPEVLDKEGSFIGFDLVIGNPPYIDIKSLDKSVVNHLFSFYQSANNRVNLFSSFIELSIKISQKKGHISQIIPTSLSSQSSYKDLRKMILDGSRILNIVRLPNETFGEHTGDVKVDTMILVLGLDSSICDLTKVIAYGGYNRITEINPATADSYQIIDQSEWLKFEDYKFSFNLNDTNQQILEKCKKNTEFLGSCADFSLGLTPYDKYRGHTQEQIKNQVFHATHQKDSTFKPLLQGNDVRNYNIVWNGKTWISYGEWLGAPREKRFFTERRILIKQIIDWTSKKIWAGITELELYNTQNAFVIIPHENFFHEYILAIINSKLMSFYHKKMFVDEYKERFQKLLIKECKLFPIKTINKNAQEPFKIEVNKIIDAKKMNDATDTSVMEATIDKMVYDLYELTADEVKIIENN